MTTTRWWVPVLPDQVHSIVEPMPAVPTIRTKRVIALTVTDQGVSSLSNFALALIVAHQSKANTIGVFAILTATYAIAQGLVRSMSSDCLMTHSGQELDQTRRYETAGYLAAIVLSTSVAVLIVAVSGLLPKGFTLPFVVFAVSFPLMACQDFSRFIGISRYKPGYAIWLDAIWLFLFLAAYCTLRVAGLVNLPWLFGAWSASGAAVGLYTLRNQLARSQHRELLRFWDKSEHAVGTRFAASFMFTTAWAYLMSYLWLFVLSVSSIGLIKLAQVVLGPITVLFSGLQSAIIAIAARQFRIAPKRAMQLLLLTGLGVLTLTVAWAAALYLAPLRFMTHALGPAWPASRKILPYGALAFGFGSLAAAANSGLRAMRAAKANLYLALAALPFLLVLSMGGAKLYGVRGAAVGLAAANIVAVVLSWSVLIFVARRFSPQEHSGGEVPVSEITDFWPIPAVESPTRQGAPPP